MAAYSNHGSMSEPNSPNEEFNHSNLRRKLSKEEVVRKKYTVLKKLTRKRKPTSVPVDINNPESPSSNEHSPLEWNESPDSTDAAAASLATALPSLQLASTQKDELQTKLYSDESFSSNSQNSAVSSSSCEKVDNLIYSNITRETKEHCPKISDQEPENISREHSSPEAPCVFVEMKDLFQRPLLATKSQCKLKCCCDSNDSKETTKQENGSNTKDNKGCETAGSVLQPTDVPHNNNTEGSNGESSLYKYFDPCYPTVIQDSIREMAQDSRFTDVIIEVEGHSFRCHRIILAASSQYFRAMFCASYRERDQSSVEIKGVTIDVMKVLIRYAYTSYLEINTENAQTVLEAASLLQFTRVMEACANYFASQLSIENAPGIMELAQRHSLTELQQLATLECVTHFSNLRSSSDYLCMSSQLFEVILSRDDLNVANEEDVFEAVMFWCQHDTGKRKSELPNLLRHVKLPLINQNYFVRHVETNELIRCNEEVHDMMMEARRYHTIGGVTDRKVIPRHNTTLHQVFVTVGGCNNRDSFIDEVCVLDFQHKTRASLCQLPNTKYMVQAGDGVVLDVGLEGGEKAKWAEFACTAWRNNLVISGGKETKKETWMYIMSLRRWVQMASLNTGRWRHRMVVCMGDIYVVGGYDGLLRVDNLEKYDERENLWIERRNMREAVSSAAVCESEDRIYVVGGGPSVRISTEKVQVYDPNTDDWRLSTPMPDAAKCLSSIALRGKIYVVGGTLRYILCFDTREEIWSKIGEDLSCARASCGVTLCNDKIFIVGGRDESGKALVSVSYLDPETHKLRLECNMPTPISHHGCVTLQKLDKLRSKTV
uniref:kelch-like protein 6 n=1 Tax=Ciona intestinalis TaxID=7719 RepID=UPI00089DD57E|nr:kelch-like protein 6 [Ciona intestinalis]|eukprot:XP_018670466.1 kelch-like protein 6 [Ciona intestinalis]